jgi:hypothetical protein
MWSMKLDPDFEEKQAQVSSSTVEVTSRRCADREDGSTEQIEDVEGRFASKGRAKWFLVEGALFEIQIHL